jgi:hypothetical protein
MSNERNLPNIPISRRLSLVLDQLESLSIFDRNFCNLKLTSAKLTPKSVPENESDKK